MEFSESLCPHLASNNGLDGDGYIFWSHIGTGCAEGTCGKPNITHKQEVMVVDFQAV